MKKKIEVCLTMIMLLCVLTSCMDGEKKVIEDLEAANKDFLDAAVSAMDNQSLCLQDKIDWGNTNEEVKKAVKEPYIDDSDQYLSKAFFAKLPSDENWVEGNEKLLSDEFISTDILSYYCFSDGGLYEYGYLAPDVNLHQYDFIKLYYTKKYGEPAREDWEWNSKSYEPTGEEDYYQMFADGKVKVLTIWDIKELDTVLVVDWLNDPVKYNNNFGQIAFYQRGDDFSIEGGDSTDE